MITDRPCCDNCPNYIPGDNGVDFCGDWIAGACVIDPPKVVPGCDGVHAVRPHVYPGGRCANHPFIAAIVKDLAEPMATMITNRCPSLSNTKNEWIHYLNTLGDVRRFLDPGKEEAP